MKSIHLWHPKKVYLFLILGGFFIANALLAEFIGVKIFSLEATLGLDPVNWTLFGIKNLSFNLTAGVLLWPVVFIMTDIINEYFGKSGVKAFSYFAAILITFAFAMVFLSISLKPADFWPGSQVENGVQDMQNAFNAIFGQGLWIIVGSLTAFLIGQFVDVFVFHQVKKATGEKYIWARTTGSTLVSQFLDSFVVLFIAFYLGAGWDMKLVISICIINYLYKFSAAVVLTPVIYWVHAAIERYLGPELAERMKTEAHQDKAIIAETT